MPHDLLFLLCCTLPAAVVGLGFGLALRRYRRPWCERYAAWAIAIPWWFYAGDAGFFLLVASWLVTRGWLSFAVMSFGFAVLELAAMGLAISRRAAAATEPRQHAEPDAAADQPHE